MIISELSDAEKIEKSTQSRSRKRTWWIGAPTFALAAVCVLAGAPAATAAPAFTSNHVCPLSTGEPGGGNGCPPPPAQDGHQSIRMVSQHTFFASDCPNRGLDGNGGCEPGTGPGDPGGWDGKHANHRSWPGCANDPGLCDGQLPGPGVTSSSKLIDVASSDPGHGCNNEPSLCPGNYPGPGVASSKSTDVPSLNPAGSPRPNGPLCAEKPGTCVS
jgi:hypothetical protein